MIVPKHSIHVTYRPSVRGGLKFISEFFCSSVSYLLSCFLCWVAASKLVQDVFLADAVTPTDSVRDRGARPLTRVQ